MTKLLYTAAVFLLGLGFAWRLISQEVKSLPKNQPLKLIATIKREPRIYKGKQVIEVADSRIYIDLYPRFRVGDRVLIEGEIDNKGRMFNPRVKLVGHKGNLTSYFSALRQRISQRIISYLPTREATILLGTVLGVDTIGEEFRSQLIKTGTIHVVVVSGQNLMIVAGIFIALGRYIGRRQSLVLGTLAVFLYSFLTGFEPPVIRASLMVLASTLAVFLGRQMFSIWQLILAALVILFFWPQAIFEISFQLTFAATFGIMTLGQYLAKIFNFKFLLRRLPLAKSMAPFGQSFGASVTILNLLGQNTAIATSAYIFTAPIILYYFGRVSLLAPVANILVVEAIFPIMILGFAVSFISLIFSPLAQILSYIAYIPAFYFVKVVEIFAKVPIEQISFGRGSMVIVIAFYILLATLMLIWMERSGESNL